MTDPQTGFVSLSRRQGKSRVASFRVLLDDQLREVFLAMPSYDDEVIPYAREQARDLGLPVETWRQHVARLIALGLATYGPVYRQEDGMPMGSSYWLTDRGVALQKAMEEV